jgi:hypothetical protein
MSSTVPSFQALPSAEAPEPGLSRPPDVWLDSVIISDFPEIFAEFSGKQFSLLWRGSRDGFDAKQFHSLCDGRANTLTVIEDTDGNIFGGFTPLEWESRKWNGKSGKEDNRWKADESLKSFVFTLKNPQNVPARRFSLRPEKKFGAIVCSSERGPHFYVIRIWDNCNVSTRNAAFLGLHYTNDTGLNGKTFFTGSESFQVKEIEVFEVMEGNERRNTGRDSSS